MNEIVHALIDKCVRPIVMDLEPCNFESVVIEKGVIKGKRLSISLAARLMSILPTIASAMLGPIADALNHFECERMLGTNILPYLIDRSGFSLMDIIAKVKARLAGKVGKPTRSGVAPKVFDGRKCDLVQIF